MNIHDEKFKKLMLQAEIAALLHDIGKFTVEFLEAGVGSGNMSVLHSINFFQHLQKQNSILVANLPDDWLVHPILNKQLLKTISDFVRLHHKFDFYEYYNSKEYDNFLLLNYILIMSDIIDSAASKGGAVFKDKKRQARLKIDLKQRKDDIYLASPFGEKFYQVKMEDLEKQKEKFLMQIEAIINDLYLQEKQLNLTYLIAKRNEMLALFYQSCCTVLAETRLPTNDISLYHHSYATTCIFKAMLARHLLLDEYKAWDNKNSLAQYYEKLAYLGICWNEDDLLSRAYRPAEIIGRRKILDEAVDEIKTYLEVELCLGNEIYRDRHGIYFLVPSLEEDKELQKEIGNIICNYIENVLNSEKSFYGDLNWKIIRRDIGISLLELSKLIFKKDGNIIGAGPRKPLWLNLWTNTNASHDICPHCGLRPKDAKEISSGSEQDAKCEQCKDIATKGAGLRKLLKYPDKSLFIQARRLFGIQDPQRLSFMTFDFEKFVGSVKDKQDKEGARIALVTAFFNLQPFISGSAFSNILIARPENFTNNPGKNDKSYDFSDWTGMLDVVDKAWNNIASASFDKSSLHTLQQVLQDSYYGTTNDGRVKGDTDLEKAQHFIKNILLNSPFSNHLSENHEAAKIINFALRLHPSPSRLARVWDTTRDFMEYIMNWGEIKKSTYIPLTMDSGSAMFLIRADNKLWQCCNDIYNEYCRRFARVRHLLPLHLSVTVFYYKSPLYVAIDAARRFNRMAMEMGEQLWTVKEKVKRQNDKYILELKDHRQRDITWTIPALLPNGREDAFYTWFWVEGNNRFPVHVSELQQGNKIYVYPSTFDYEILDTTTRRYDIRISQNHSRPHLFCGSSGPRPYPLSVWQKWHDIGQVLLKVETSQIKHLVEQLGYIHANWSRESEHDAIKGMCEDLLRVMIGKYASKEQYDKLLNMAMDGSLFDLVEWQDFICQLRKQQEEK